MEAPLRLVSKWMKCKGIHSIPGTTAIYGPLKPNVSLLPWTLVGVVFVHIYIYVENKNA